MNIKEGTRASGRSNSSLRQDTAASMRKQGEEKKKRPKNFGYKKVLFPSLKKAAWVRS